MKYTTLARAPQATARRQSASESLRPGGASSAARVASICSGKKVNAPAKTTQAATARPSQPQAHHRLNNQVTPTYTMKRWMASNSPNAMNGVFGAAGGAAAGAAGGAAAGA